MCIYTSFIALRRSASGSAPPPSSPPKTPPEKLNFSDNVSSVRLIYFHSLQEKVSCFMSPSLQSAHYREAQNAEYRGRANMAHARQSRPDSGLCFQIKTLHIFEF